MGSLHRVYHTEDLFHKEKVMDVRKGGQALREVREAKRLTQAQVSEQAGIRQQKLSEIETGIMLRPDMEYLVRVARVLEISLELLVEFYEIEG